MFDPEKLFDGVVDMAGPPTACCWGPGRLDAFYQTPANRLGHVWWDGSLPEADRWNREVFDDLVPAELTVCTATPGTLHLFWRDSPASLVHKVFDGGWHNLSVPASPGGAPAACSWARDRIDLFWQGVSGQLEHRWWDGRSWNNFEMVAGPASPDIAVCSWGPERLDIFWREPSGALGQIWRDGTSDWNRFSHPAAFEGRPAACSQAPGTIDIVVRNSDGLLWHYWWDFNKWSGWHQRPGQYALPPAICSWGDGRLDVLLSGMDHKLWHAWWSGQPVHTQPVKTVWQVGNDGIGDKAFRLLESFAAGALPGCSGAMISPHFFLTAGHCGGAGHVKPVRFFHIDPFASPGVDGSQVMTPDYIGRAWPWASWSPGDSQLYWLPDGPGGVPPGIRYGYQEISPNEVALGTGAYSFWVNPAARLDSTLLYSDGVATNKGTDPVWLGPFTDYDMWTLAGASGSTVLAPAHGHRAVGTTQGGPQDWPGAKSRVIPDANAFVGRFDADHDGILDAVEYDWLMTKPVRDVLYARFDLPIEQTHWVSVPEGSARATVASGTRIHDLSGEPVMTADGNALDGYWELTSRFRPNGTYRVTVAAAALRPGLQGGYVKFRSDRTGNEVITSFRTSDEHSETAGTVTLGPEDDYRLILGVDAGSSVRIWEIAVLLEQDGQGQPVSIGFDTHDARRMWNYGAGCYPAARGVRDIQGFSAVVAGPTPVEPGGIWNYHLALHTSRSYVIRWRTRTGTSETNDGQSCWLRLLNPSAGAFYVAAEQRWSLGGTGDVQEHELTLAGTSVPTVVALGCDSNGAYLVGDLSIILV